MRLPVEMSSRPLEDLRKLVVQNDCLLVGAAAVVGTAPAPMACPSRRRRRPGRQEVQTRRRCQHEHLVLAPARGAAFRQ